MVPRRRQTDKITLASLSEKWARLPTVAQVPLAVAGAFGSVLLGAHVGLSWLEAQSSLGPRMVRVEALAVRDSSANVRDSLNFMRQAARIDSLAVFARDNRTILEGVDDGVFRLLCREDGGSPALCDARALDRRRVEP